MWDRWLACSEASLENLRLSTTIEFSRFLFQTRSSGPKRQRWRLLSGFGASLQRFLGEPASWTSLWSICCSGGTQTWRGQHGSFQCACLNFPSEKSWSGTACIGKDARQCGFSGARKTCSLRILWIRTHASQFAESSFEMAAPTFSFGLW